MQDAPPSSTQLAEPQPASPAPQPPARILQEAVGAAALEEIALSYLDLLKTSTAIYERDGHCALGIFRSNWCELLCSCRASLCHQACWEWASKPSIDRRQAVDVECPGGLRIYALPILAQDEVVGSINFGYGTPPREPQRLAEIGRLFGADLQRLHQTALEHPAAAPGAVEAAKRLLWASAQLIGRIVQQHRTGRAMQEHEGLLRTIVENAGEMLWMTDPARTRAFYVSPQSQELLGLSPEDLMTNPRRLLELVHPEDRPRVEELILAPRPQGRAMEFRIIRPDGATRWLRERAFPVGGEHGESLRVVGILSDITDSRRTQQALAKSQERYRAVSLLCSDFAFCYVRTSGRQLRLEWMTGAFERGTGFRPDQVHRLSGWQRIVYPEDYERFKQFLRGLRSGKADVLEHRILNRQGQVRWLRVMVRPVLDSPTGKPVRFLCAAQDITHHRNAEEQLRASESRYRIMGETVPYGVWLAQPDGRLSYASQSFLDLLGITRDQLPNKSLPEFLDAPQARRVSPAWQGCLETGSDWDHELTFRHNGQERVVLSRGRCVRDRLGRITCWVGVNLDITDRKQAERALEELNATLERRVADRTMEARRRSGQLQALAGELLQAEQRERSRLAQTLHDGLQQLLVSAKFSLAILRNRLSDPALEALVDQADQLIGQSIEGTRSLTFELSPPILQDRGLAASLDWLGRWMLQKHGLAVEVLADPAADPYDHQLAVLMFQSCKELLFNVVKHAKAPAARLAFVMDEQGRCCATVSDQGCGFAPAQLHRQQAEGRFGLLSIFERMSMVGGRCEVDSRPGGGTQVRLTIPRRLGSAAEIAPEGKPLLGAYISAPPLTVDPGRQKIRVLLADDHQMLRQGLAELLCCHSDIEVVGEAANGLQAVELVRQLQPDVVVMDVSMPRQSGIEATRELTRVAPHVRVIGLSIHPEADMASAMRQAGAAGYLSKDGPVEALVAAIRSCAPQPFAIT